MLLWVVTQLLLSTKTKKAQNVATAFGDGSLRKRNVAAAFGHGSLRKRNVVAAFGHGRLARRNVGAFWHFRGRMASNGMRGGCRGA